MKRPVSVIERLDFAARTQTSTALISRVRVILVFLTIFITLLAISSTAPFRETLLLRVLAAISAMVTAILWQEWRYKLYALAILAFCFGIADVLSVDHPRNHTVLGWISAHSQLPMFAYFGCGLWIIARRYAIVNGSDWQKEREQLAEWLGILSNPSSVDVVEFATGSFWTGYWNYRIVKEGDYWIIAKFKRGTTKLAGYYVRQPNEVTFTVLPSGKWKVDITMGKKRKSFTEIEISRSLPSGFEPFTQQVNV
jgi:hypothetical protein